MRPSAALHMLFLREIGPCIRPAIKRLMRQGVTCRDGLPFDIGLWGRSVPGSYLGREPAVTMQA